jgi:hypothetical protein
VASSSGEGITVSGTGNVSVVPTKASWSFTVSAAAPSASGAFDQVKSKATSLLKAVRAQGIPDKDIQTSTISLSPNYDNSVGASGNKVSGYTASDTIDVQSSIGDSGALVDAAVAAGASQVDGPSLSPSDSEALYQQALKLAFDRARSRAQALADAAGVKLGGVTAISTQGSSSPIVEGAALSPSALGQFRSLPASSR